MSHNHNGLAMEVFVIVVVLAIIAAMSSPGSGVHVNDLSRWEQFGGTLKRPHPPPPSNRSD
jgi:hypothetical protein